MSFVPDAITEYEPKTVLLVDSNGSPLMNVNGAASGATEGIHDGTDSALWTASSISGTWDFASTTQAASPTKSIDGTATTNGDQALITRSTPLSAGSYTLLTGEIYLTAYSSSKNTVEISGRLAGVASGIAVNIGDYIDTGSFNVWQHFQIPMSAFAVTTTIDEMLITVTSTGTPPDFYLDDIGLREGGGIVYTPSIGVGEVFQYNRIDMVMSDAYTGIATVAGSTENATMLNLSYDRFLGLPRLSTGITFQRVVSGVVISSGDVKGIDGVIISGGSIMSSVSDGTNTMLHIRIELQDWARLSDADGDGLPVIINDDMTGLLDFKMSLSGREVKQ